MSFHREVHQQMAVAQVVAYKTPWASMAFDPGPLRFGSIMVFAAKAQNLGGARVKVQGTNLGSSIDVTAVVASGLPLDPGGLNPTDLGWVDLGYQVDLPPNLDVSQFVPPMPAPGQMIAWDTDWIRLVVTPGPGGITLNAWAKFKSGQ